ncbi:hypothetical protein C0J52_20298 [Blattella germanica]|nr:hypothetical protein C0J52_20298 [Blattella germanica]
MLLFETYPRKRSYLKCRIRFIRKFPGISVPNKSSIHRLVGKVRVTEKLDDIGACFEQSPHKSLSKLAQQVGVSVSSVWNATKILKFKLYKIGLVHKIF